MALTILFKKLSFFFKGSILLLFLMISLSAIQNKNFPPITCNTLKDKDVQLPKILEGKYSILAFSMSNQAESSLRSWFKPIFYSFIYKPDKDVLFKNDYDVNLYFVSMYASSDNSGLNKAKSRYNTVLDDKLKPYVLTYQGDLKSMQSSLDLSSFKVPCILLLDEQGKIVFKAEGDFSETKMMEIEDILDGF